MHWLVELFQAVVSLIDPRVEKARLGFRPADIGSAERHARSHPEGYEQWEKPRVPPDSARR